MSFSFWSCVVRTPQRHWQFYGRRITVFCVYIPLTCLLPHNRRGSNLRLHPYIRVSRFHKVYKFVFFIGISSRVNFERRVCCSPSDNQSNISRVFVLSFHNLTKPTQVKAEISYFYRFSNMACNCGPSFTSKSFKSFLNSANSSSFIRGSKTSSVLKTFVRRGEY